MKYIYNCYGGSHSSVTAAAIHVGFLPSGRIPDNRELLLLPYYDAQVAADHGRIRMMGYDEKGNEVYIASKHNLGLHYQSIMRNLMALAGEEQGDVVFVDTMPYVNIFMVIGGFLSRRWGWIGVGRKIVLYGTRLSFNKFVHLVDLVKKGNFK